MRLTKLHEIIDRDKVDQISNNMARDGWAGHPILVMDMGNEMLALTGVHRIAAAEEAGIEPYVHYIEGEINSDVPELWEALGDAIDDDARLAALRDLNDAGKIDDYALEIMQAEVRK